MIRVITMLMAGLPDRSLEATNSAAMPAALVSISSITAGTSSTSGGPDAARGHPSGAVWSSSWPPPRPPVAGEHRVGGRRAPGAGLVGLGPSVLGPVRENRVEDLPGPLHLGVPGEQGRLAEEHVEDQSLVGLGAGLGERAAVREVHVHVADLHLRAGHL